MKSFAVFLIVIFASPSFATEVRFEGAARVKRGNSAFEDVKEGQSIELKAGESVLALPRQGLPLMIFQPASSSSKIVVSDADLREAVRAELQPKLESATSEIVNGLRKAESFIQRKNHEQARAIVGELKQKYPGISSVLFLSGTVNYLLNDRASAIEDLQAGLALDSTNDPARRLLERLKGNK